MKSGLKIVAINAFVLFAIISAIAWAVCIVNTVDDVLKHPALASTLRASKKSTLPNYRNADWAAVHFAEFDALPTKYVSYIGWRRKAYAGKTITVSGPYLQRRTVARPNPTKPTVYFFGGSTMWGTGSTDDLTIPSQFSQLSGHPAENFGETAYTAHQSLTLLMRLLQDGRRPDVVVFYDGVNEVVQKCRAELNETSHAREAGIAAALERKLDLSYLLWPMQELAKDIVKLAGLGASEGKQFDCHTDTRKAQKIAENLLRDWEMARLLVESYKGRFIGVLQPVAYFSDTKLDRLDLSETERSQFAAVYPLIEKEVAKRSHLHNLVGALDHDEYIYVDFCHVSPNGNRLMAEEIAKIVDGEPAESLTGARMAR